MPELSLPGGRKPPVLCHYAFRLSLNNEVCWQEWRKWSDLFWLIVTLSDYTNNKRKTNLSFLLRLISWWQDYFFIFGWYYSANSLFFSVWWSELYSCFLTPPTPHYVSGSLPEQCFLKTPLPPSLSQSEGAVKTSHHLSLFYIINPQLASLNLSWHCLLFVVCIEMPRPCIPVRQSTVMSSASPRGRIFQMVSRDKKGTH